MRGKSPAAFKKNVEEEIEAGKPQKQAVAIAYAEKAKAEGVKHLADGGVTGKDEDDDPTADIKRELADDAEKIAQRKAATDPTSITAPASGPAKRELVRPCASFLGHELIAPEYASPTADDLLPPSAEESAASDATAPVGASEATGPDLGGIEAAERRLEAANTANADLGSTDPAEADAAKALAEEGKAAAEGGKAEAEISGQAADAIAKADDASKAREDAWQAKYQPLYEAFQKSKVDPEARWKSLGFGGKALSVIGAALGAFATGYSRGAIPNMAQHVIDNAIEQNIAAQRSNIAKDGQALEFMRQHHVDEAAFDQLSRLSMREAFGARLAAVHSTNLSEQAQAHINTLIADNALKIAEIKHAAAGGAGVLNAQANYAIEAEKARLVAAGAAAGAAPPAKPADVDKVNKSVLGLQALDQLSKLVAAGAQASALGSKIGAPGVRLASAVPASATEQAMKFRTQAAMIVANALNPDQSRQPPPEVVAKIEAMLPSPLMTEAQNKIAHDQLYGTLIGQKRDHFLAAYGAMPDDTDPYQIAPTPVGRVLVVSPSGQRGHIPAEQLPAALAAGYKRVGGP